MAVMSRHSDCPADLPRRMNLVDVAVVFDLAEHWLDRDLALCVELPSAVGGELVTHLLAHAVSQPGRVPSRMFPSGGASTSIP